ncbi:MAG TPA: ATP-binding protein [Terriglobales bacterium]|nr:ATP-binding protein [Terriglobales bacterium]
MLHHFTSLLRLLELGSRLAPFLAANVYLVERRGRQEKLNPTRQVEIGTLLESMPDAVMIIDTDRRIIDLNQSAARLFASTPEQLRHRRLSEIRAQLMDAPGEAIRFRRKVVDRALNGETVREEQRAVRDPITGKEVQLLISANPICDQAGKTVGALVIARDITELTQLQNRFSDMERHLAIGQVAAGIAHDFNNTLETISHAVVLLQAEPEPPLEQRRALLRLIRSAVEHGTGIIARIRDYVRSGTGDLTRVSVRALLDDALELTEHLRHRRHRVQLMRELSDVPPVNANAADLRRVFTNLIINASQAMPEGGQLTVGCRREAQNIHIWIRDTGAGISEEDQKKLFLPYFTTKHGGTGLGLSGAQKIMLAMHGDIRFHSEPGKGTQFDIYLPVAEAERKTA